MLLQTYEEWECHIWTDGFCERSRGLISDFIDRMSLTYEYLPKIQYFHSEKRENLWGHNLRKQGLERVTTEYVCETNADNYLCPRYLELMLKAIDENGLGFVLSPCVHSYPNVNFQNDPAYSVLVPEPRIDRVDWVNVMLRTDIARSVDIRVKERGADGHWMEDILRSNPGLKWGRLSNILSVHN